MGVAQVVTVEFGPWTRVLDTARAGDASAEMLRDLVDGWIAPEGRVISRPGFRALATHPGAPGAAQGIAGMELAGTFYTFAVVGGVLAGYDWALDQWTTLTHTGATINATGPVALVSFFDKLIVSDGVNRPWSYVPASGVGTPLGCSTGPWWARPIVRDAKLFGIKANQRRMFVWSEEADETIGGEALVSGKQYNNAWDLRQTSQSALVALIATNSATLYQRAGSSGQILGEVDTDYQASGTNDDLAEKQGTFSPFVPLVTDDATLWSLNQEGRPYRVRPGAGVEPLWLQCQETVKTVGKGQLAVAWAVYLPDVDAVAYALPRTTGNTHNTDLLLFDRSTGNYLGRWRVPTGAGASVTDLAWGATARDDSGVERLIVMDRDGTVAAMWRKEEADLDAAKWLDVNGANSSLPATRIVLPDASSAEAEQALYIQWTQAILETGDPRDGTEPPVLAATGGVTLTYDCETPQQAFGFPSVPLTVPLPGKLTIGLKRFGRWMRFAVAAVAGDGSQRFVVWRVTLIGSQRDVLAKRK